MYRIGAAWKLPALFLPLGLLAGCVTATVTYPNSNGDRAIPPFAAVQLAANAEGSPVQGRFLIHVEATGRQDGNIYLNSQSDYRDQRNLSVEITPAASIAFQQKYGESPDKFFQSKDILISGDARRVKVLFYSDGKPTGLYYYQTHVRVTDTGQIQAKG